MSGPSTDPRDVYVMQWCTCPEGVYYGAQKMGTPPRCERCGFLPSEPWVHAAMLDALTRHSVLTEQVAEHGLCDLEGWHDQRRLVTAWEVEA